MDGAPSPAPSGGAVAQRVAWCCGLGCVFVVAFAIALSWLGWTRVGKPATESLAALEAARAGTAEAEADLARLDRQSPPPEAVEAATRELSALDVDRYVAVREALAAQLGETSSAWDTLLAEIAPPPEGRTFADLIGAALGGLQGGARLAAARGQLLASAVPALESQGVGPTEELAVAELVEWRYLGRPDALPLALPEWRRSELWQLRMEVALLEAWGQGSAHVQVDGQDAAHALESARQRLAEIESEAEQRRDLAPATRALLDARRAELVALGDRAPGLAWLALPSDAGGKVGLQ